jgi:glycosyltransferase involved in cell wall biosynthesis
MKNRYREYYYFAFESIFDPVFDSQVVEFIKEFNKGSDDDRKITLVVFGSFSDLISKKYTVKRKRIRKALEGRCRFFFKLPYFFKYPSLFSLSIFLNTVIALKALSLLMRLNRSGKMVFHCRTEIASYILLNIRNKFYKKAKLICDCRGVGSKEILYKFPGKKGISLSKKIKNIEDAAHKRADQLFCVSKSFKEYINKKSGEKIKIEVIPCCINKDKFYFNSIKRREKRKELDIENRFTVLYSGSLNMWQLPEEIIKIFLEFRSYIKDSILVIFTRDTGIAEKLLKKYDLNNDSYIVGSKSFDEISSYLPVGDIGLLIREENEVNRIAFPIKYTEYVRSGVPVFTSITSDIDAFLEKYNTGFKIKDFKDVSEIRNVISDIKQDLDNICSNAYKKRISNVIGEKFGWSAYTPKIKRIYQMITDE